MAEQQIYRSRNLKRQFFGFKVERPQAPPGTLLVLMGGGATIVLQPGQKPTAGEAAWNRYDTVIEVDTSSHELAFTTPVKAKGGDVSFSLTFAASYRVSDALRVINEAIDNPAPALRRVITESIGRVTEQYDIEDVQGAINAVRRDVLDKAKYTEKMPFELSAVNFSLDLDANAQAFLAKRRELKREAELATGGMEGIEAKAKVEELSQTYRRALEKQEAAHVLAMQKMRMDVYRPMIQGGTWELLAQRLAQNPEDIDRVTDLVTQLHGQQLAADVTTLEALLKGDRIDDHNLRPVIANLIDRLRGTGPTGPTWRVTAEHPKQIESSTAEEQPRT